MTWFIKDNRTWAQKIFGDILKCGEIPKHVALIMDGNRRFAREKNMQKIQGHISGFEKLVEVNLFIFISTY
jgi:ditrans,polycis-polyprenyl diphosphate synthase